MAVGPRGPLGPRSPGRHGGNRSGPGVADLRLAYEGPIGGLEVLDTTLDGEIGQLLGLAGIRRTGVLGRVGAPAAPTTA